MPAPAIICDLVERFELHYDSYQSAGYNEAQLRQEFLDPCFKAAGWDIDNEQGHAEAYKDVIHEDAIKVGGEHKAPDYCFRIGGRRIFFLEAKKPAVKIRKDRVPAFQLRRYAWSAKLPLSILSTFEWLAVYDCRIKPHKQDKPSVARVMLLNYKEYDRRWNELADIFSRDAVLKGSFDKFAESTKLKRGTTEVNAAFLREIEKWRDVLARNFALRNPDLSQRDLNFAVQRTIDRIIFLRMCEDRGIENYGQLASLLGGDAPYRRLCELLDLADERYNSGLFHFREEKGRAEPPDELTQSLVLDDKPLRDIVHRLYYPNSPYEFSVLPAEILGQVYEQFLGKVIRLTAGHRAIVEDKPEVKKAGGVYYTPAYIVDYIVRETVGKLVEGRAPKQVAKLRVLDPACGSGSFLVGAFQFLLDWHRDRYVQDGVKGRSKEIYQGPGGQWHLTTAEKKRILLNNIYGVDIDSQAVEVTKLSLLLKVLEHENRETLERQLRFLHERALPDLGNNIKCGNSLIGTDFCNGRQMSLLDEDERYRINVFDWQAEFPQVFKRREAGFDAVIGNPPWGATFSDTELAYFRIRYARVISRMIDSYLCFFDRATRLARADGPVGFIVPSTILNQVDAEPLRRLLLQRGLRALISLGTGVFGRKVLNTSTVVVSAPADATHEFGLADLSSCGIGREKAIFSSPKTPWPPWKGSVQQDPHFTFFVGAPAERDLIRRMRSAFPSLKDLLVGRIQRGVSPDVVAAHVVSVEEARRRKIEAELLRPSVSGSEIRRYQPWAPDQLIIYTTRETDINGFPRALDYLKQYRPQNTCKEVTSRKHPWWCLHRPRDPAIFRSPKFIGLTTSKRVEVVYDRDRSIFVTDAMYVFSLKPEINPLALMAILLSRAFDLLYRVANQGESRVIPQVKASKLVTLPIPWVPSAAEKWNDLGALCDRVLAGNRELVSARTPDAKTRRQREIDATESQIDRLVYEFYGLTGKEIALIGAGDDAR